MSKRPFRAVRVIVVTAASVALVAGLTACSSGGSAAGSSGSISLVASTDVWGDIARQVAGDAVRITSIITDPAADPHSYEADAQVLLELSKASVVVENGGGYDDFVGTMLASLGHRPTVLDAVDISGKQAAAGGSLNEHVWYDFPSVQAVAARIAAALTAADPTHAADFAANERTFDGRLAALGATEAAIKARSAGVGVAITEPVPLYLTDSCGLVDRTPAAFSAAVEDGTGVAPSVLAATLALFADHAVKLLVYNAQTSGPETEQVLAAAKTNHIDAVPVTETLPSGKDYLTWMTDNLAAIANALAA